MLTGERIVLCAVEREDLLRRIQWVHDLTVQNYSGNILPIPLSQEAARFEKMFRGASACNFPTDLEEQHIGGGGPDEIDCRNRNAEVGLFMVKPEYV
jgi:hypothetical protein